MGGGGKGATREQKQKPATSNVSRILTLTKIGIARNAVRAKLFCYKSRGQNLREHNPKPNPKTDPPSLKPPSFHAQLGRRGAVPRAWGGVVSCGAPRAREEVSDDEGPGDRREASPVPPSSPPAPPPPSPLPPPPSPPLLRFLILIFTLSSPPLLIFLLPAEKQIIKGKMEIQKKMNRTTQQKQNKTKRQGKINARALVNKNGKEKRP